MAKITIDHGYIFQASATGTLFREKGIQGRESQIFSALQHIQIPDKPCSDPTASTTTTPGEWVWGYI